MNALNNDDKAARTRMEQAEKASTRQLEAAKAAEEDSSLPRRPQRYKLYDRIKDRISLTAINGIIVATALLLVIAIVYGIATGSGTP